MRSSKNAEQNAFAQAVRPFCIHMIFPVSDVIKTSGSDSLDSSDVKAIITVTVYDRLSWGAGSVTRASQHALLSSQTLSDVFDLVPCPPNGLAVESASPTPPCEEQLQATTNTDDCVICINGIAYGNGSQTDYAEYVFLPFDPIHRPTFGEANSCCTCRLFQKTAHRSQKLKLQFIKPFCQLFRFVSINLTGCSIMATASILL